ncbi:MAG: ankyrin repeat domain-containing protein [Armatimonadota bacterium]
MFKRRNPRLEYGWSFQSDEFCWELNAFSGHSNDPDINQEAKFLELLGQDGARENLRGGVTGLMIFVRSGSSMSLGRIEVVDQLLAWGTDINAADHDGNTALHFAMKHPSAAKVNCLLQRGANLRLANARGMTPLQVLGSMWTTNDCRSASHRTDAIAPSIRHPSHILEEPAKAFMLHGAKPEEFAFSDPVLLESALKFYARILAARNASTCLIGCIGKSRLARLVGKDILIQLARSTYQTRAQNIWSKTDP